MIGAVIAAIALLAAVSCGSAPASNTSTLPPTDSSTPAATATPTPPPVSTGPAPTYDFTPIPLIYEVDGSGEALVTYSLPEHPNSTQQQTVTLPWTYTDAKFMNIDHQGIVLSAQLHSSGAISCKIVVEYKGGSTTIASASSSGQYVVVSCVPNR